MNRQEIVSPPINYNKPSFLGGKHALDENQQSSTFRTVGPNEDSTVNYKGKKYSDLYQNSSSSNMKAGFYGKSRLTR